MVHVVLYAWCRCADFILLRYFSISSGWSRRHQSWSGIFLGFYQRVSMSLLGCLCIWYCWKLFSMNLLMRWCTSVCCSIEIGLRRCLVNFNFMFPRSLHYSIYWRRWSSLWLANFCFTCFNLFCATLRLLMMFLMQCLSMFTYLFIVLMILFIFSFFDILPNLCDFINFHRNTSRVALARSGDHVLLYSFLLREASVYSTHVEISLSSASIFGRSLMFSLLNFHESVYFVWLLNGVVLFYIRLEIFLVFFLLVWYFLIVLIYLIGRYCFGLFL